MRTTLTLDPDVAARLTSEIRRTGRGMKSIVNDALRRALGSRRDETKPNKFVVQPFSLGMRPGLDLHRMNQLADELEVAEHARRMRR